MKGGTRLLIAGALLIVVATVGLVLLLRFDSANAKRYDEYLAAWQSDPAKAAEELANTISTDRTFDLWLRKHLKRDPDPADLHAAHVLCGLSGNSLTMPLEVAASAMRYRYNAGLSPLPEHTFETAEPGFRFANPDGVKGSRSHEVQFWHSFYSLDAMGDYFALRSFDEFQALCRAILACPYFVDEFGFMPGSGPRAAAAFCLDTRSAALLASSDPQLPWGLATSVGPLSLGPELEALGGSNIAVDRMLSELRKRPHLKAQILARLLAFPQERAREIVLAEIEKGELSRGQIAELLAPAWSAGMELPENWISDGIRSPDPATRSLAMMHSMLQPGSIRLRRIRDCLTGNYDLPRYLLIHRLENDDLDSGIIQHLKQMFAGSLADWPNNRHLAFTIAAKLYQAFGPTGLVDLLPPDLFPGHSEPIADVLQLLGCPDRAVTHTMFMNWVTGFEGEPIWWLVGHQVLAEDVKAEDVFHSALAGLLRLQFRLDPDDERRSFMLWFVADALEPVPFNRKQMLAPARVVGLSASPTATDLLREAFRRSDERNIRGSLADREVRSAFFSSFRSGW